MTTHAPDIPTTIRRLPTLATVALSIVLAVIGGSLASAAIAAIAHGAGVSHSFKPLQVGTFAALIIFGVLAGAIGWQLVRTKAQHPEQLLTRLVPIVLALSFIPDILLGVAKGEGATWGGVFALMAMHVVVAACAVTSYSILLPAKREPE